MKTNLTKRLATLGIISICAVGVLTGCATTSTGTIEPTTSTSPEDIKPSTPGSTSPTGPRPILNHKEDRYVFLNNGQIFELTTEQLGTEIGTQEGGTLFELKGYDQAFRMAFKYDDAFYILENVGKSDDSKIDIAEYLKTANLQEHVVYADVFSHIGDHLLNGLAQEDAIKLLDTLATAQIAELKAEEFDAIGKAQSEDKSFRVDFTLDDFTVFSIHIIPSMNYVTIGDYTCVVEDLEAKVGSYFENLEVREDVIYN